MTVLGAIFPPDQPPEQLKPVAVAADRAGLDEVWLWEDCFKESGIAASAAVLGWTEHIRVGIGLLPVPLRNVALTAMELATIERLFPGRVVPGIGHGVLHWMGQVGARAESPMTLLREYATALRDLLHGATVTSDGRYVRLDQVALDWPADPPPPLLIGAVKEKTARLAGELSDGVILTGETTPGQLEQAVGWALDARRTAGRDGQPEFVVFVAVDGTLPAATIAERAQEFATRGATRVALLDTSNDPDLVAFVTKVGQEVAPLLS